MKEAIGLAVFAMVSIFTIGMAIGRRIHTSLAVVLLLFAMASGWGIAHHDWLRQLQFQVPGLDLYQAKVAQIRDDALYDLKTNLAKEREDIASTLSTGEDLQQKLATERQTIEELLENVRTLEDSLKAREQTIKETNEQAQAARDQMVAVQQAVSEISLALTRVIYLYFEANDQFGQERAQAAIRQIMDQLDDVVRLCIVDPQARADFVLGVTNSLPPRQGN